MKTTALLFVIALALIFAAPAHAQLLGDDGSSVLNRDLPPDPCPTYDSCSMDTGAGADPNANWASGVTSCRATRCLECGNDGITGKASCYYRQLGLSGSCQCSTTTSYDAQYGVNVTRCSATGQCTYRG